MYLADKIIVVSNCKDSIDVEKSIIRLSHTDYASINCTWTMFAPTKTQITITISEPFNSNFLRLSDGSQLTEDSLLRDLNFSNMQSRENVLKVLFDSKSSPIENDLYIHYKLTTGMTIMLYYVLLCVRY